MPVLTPCWESFQTIRRSESSSYTLTYNVCPFKNPRSKLTEIIRSASNSALAAKSDGGGANRCRVVLDDCGQAGSRVWILKEPWWPSDTMFACFSLIRRNFTETVGAWCTTGCGFRRTQRMIEVHRERKQT